MEIDRYTLTRGLTTLPWESINNFLNLCNSVIITLNYGRAFYSHFYS